MRRWRIVLATAGILLGLFGVARLLTQVPASSLIGLGVWLVAAVAIHDGLLSPLVVTVGWFLRRHLPPRGRRYVQAGLIVGAVVTVVAVPMIYLQGSQPASKAILDQHFGANLTLLLGILGAMTLLAYAVRVARDRGGSGRKAAATGAGDSPPAA
jgi:hypothetical protein